MQGEGSMGDDLGDKDNPRRGFLKQVAAVSGASLVAVAPAVAAPAPGAPAVNEVTGYNSLSADEAAFVEAMVSIMCPADEFTPNGVDCGLAIYIDRQLAGSFGKGAKRYLRGPAYDGAHARLRELAAAL